MWRIIIPGLIFLISMPAVAAPSRVQSGEHIGFTRLVAEVSKAQGWEIEEDDRKVILTLNGHTDGFDISQVFKLIPKDRIQRIDSNKESLIIYLGCDCEVLAFDVSGGYIALDIISEKQPRPLSSRSKVSVNPQRKDQTESKVTQILTSKAQEPARWTTKEEELAALSETQMRLSDELGKAVTKGLLAPYKPQFITRRPQVDLDSIESNKQPSETHDSVQPRLDNMRISTSMDTPLRIDTSRPVLLDSGFVCPADDTANIANWGDSRSFDKQISEVRLDLFDELGALNYDKAIELAKRYLYFSFGHEARQVLRLLPALNEKDLILLDITEIMESTGAETDLSSYNYLECKGNIALWSFLAQPLNPNIDGIFPTEILLAANNLPVHLRRHLTPALSSRFLAGGDRISATNVLRNLDRLSGSDSAKQSLAEANLTIDLEVSEDATKKLQYVIDANVEQSPEALIRLINAKVTSDQKIDLETVGLAEAYAQELEATDLGPDLRKAYIISLLEIQDFDRAIGEIYNLNDIDLPSLKVEMINALIRKTTQGADDILFLDIILQQDGDDLELLDTETKKTAASRLLELGFANDAAHVLGNLASMSGDEEIQILSAQIALALDQPFQAQAHLLGLSTKASDILRAEAMTVIGNHDDAHTLYASTGESDQARRSAWLANSWRDLTPSDSSSFGPIRALDKAISESSPDPAGMLTRAMGALEESSQARSTMRDLLAMPDLYSTDAE